MADKTPGEVAWEAYRSALVETPGQPPGGGYTSPAWEAAARAVRKQVGEELQAIEGKPGPIIAQAVTDMGRIRDIRKLAREFKVLPVPDDRDHNEEDKDDLINAIVAILDGPTREEAEACAEDAGAEPSKSPPPAKR